MDHSDTCLWKRKLKLGKYIERGLEVEQGQGGNKDP